MIIIQILALLFGVMALFFLVWDTLTMFLSPSLDTLKDIMFSGVVIIICAAITGVIQLNLSSTGVF
jgi:hypothetical protein